MGRQIGERDGDGPRVGTITLARSFGFWRKRVSLAILGLTAPFAPPLAAKLHVSLFSPAQQSVQTYGLGDWRLNIITSHFSGDIQCRLRSQNGKSLYMGQAVGFRFGKDADTLGAWVKIGDAPAMRWRDFLPALATLRLPVSGKNLAAPTDGIVWLPADDLERVEHVVIQLDKTRRPKAFSLEGFSELRAAARRLGCEPEARFIP